METHGCAVKPALSCRLTRGVPVLTPMLERPDSGSGRARKLEHMRPLAAQTHAMGRYTVNAIRVLALLFLSVTGLHAQDVTELCAVRSPAMGPTWVLPVELGAGAQIEAAPFKPWRFS